MGLTYFKRYRMEIDLEGPLFPCPSLPPEYALYSWDPSLVDAHADTKFRSFCFEIDANVFPCLGEKNGCRRLMRDIVQRESFVPSATWLIAHTEAEGLEYCGTIQGIADRHGRGAVQNVGVTPCHRGRSLGTLLLYRALLGFRQIGIGRAYLEVTAQNSGAVRLYQRLGFARVETVYKAADVAYA